jgi:hypothetical protein
MGETEDIKDLIRECKAFRSGERPQWYERVAMFAKIPQEQRQAID